jgi:hypothetical protein
LTVGRLQPLLSEAARRWGAATADPAVAARLAGVEVRVADLADNLLGLAAEGADLIWLDIDAAGHGWFVDETPQEDSEFEQLVGGQQFAAGLESPALGRVDLLTVVTHELGHLLGLADLNPLTTPHQLMTGTLPASTRRLPLWSAPEPVAHLLSAEDTPTLAPAPVLPAMPPGPSAPPLLPDADGLTPPDTTAVPAAPPPEDLAVALGASAPQPVVPSVSSPASLVEGPAELRSPASPDNAVRAASEEVNLTWLMVPLVAEPAELVLPTGVAQPDPAPTGIFMADSSTEALLGGDGDSLLVGEEGGTVLVGGMAAPADESPLEAREEVFT